MAAVDIRHVAFAYGKKPLFSDLSVSFGEGEFCTVVGPNGCGKTTLLKCMAGLLPVSQGAVMLNGRPLSSYSRNDMARTVAYVPQRQDLTFDIPVCDMVMMGRNPYQGRWQTPAPDDRRIVCKVLEKCRLAAMSRRMTGELSGGEMQRAVIARAMAQLTPVILLDEPLANLDVAHKYEIMDILRQLNDERHVTVVMVVHDFPIALEYAKQALLIDSGATALHGSAEAVLTPENLRKCFRLGPEYEIHDNGFVSKRHDK